MKTIAILLITTLMIGCSNTAYHSEGLNSFETESIKIEVERFNSGIGNTDYYLHIIVQNLTNTELFFDTADLELVNPTTGISYYSISRDLSKIKLNSNGMNLLTSTKLMPNRKIMGYVLFPTGSNNAKAESLELFYSNKKLSFID